MAKYIVGGVEMSAREMIDFAEQQYGCQSGEALQYTSVAAEELRKHGIEVMEK